MSPSAVASWGGIITIPLPDASPVKLTCTSAIGGMTLETIEMSSASLRAILGVCPVSPSIVATASWAYIPAKSLIFFLLIL